MKKIIVIVSVVLCLVSCKKEEKCLIGGKWYYEKYVTNSSSTINPLFDYLIVYDNKVEYYKNDGTLYSSENTIITNELIGVFRYECNGNTLKVFNNNQSNDYIQYKR